MLIFSSLHLCVLRHSDALSDLQITRVYLCNTISPKTHFCRLIDLLEILGLSTDQ